MDIFRQGAFEMFYDFPLKVDWSLTDMCNYRCSYCFSEKKKIQKERFQTVEQIKRAIDHIAALQRPWYEITLAGGEPTMHPALFEILEGFHENLGDKLSSILIITNGSNSDNLYEKLFRLSSRINLNLQISIHTEYVNMEHIIDLVKLLSNNIRCHFALMYHPERKEQVHDIFKRMLNLRKEYPFSLKVVLLRPIRKEEMDISPLDIRYIEEDFKWQIMANKEFQIVAKDSGMEPKYRCSHTARVFYDMDIQNERKVLSSLDFERSGFNSNNYQEMYCIAGSHMLRIDPDGGCRGMVCNADVSKYNIFNENPYLHDDFIHAVKCPFKTCGCTANALLPKFSSHYEGKCFVDICREKQKALIRNRIW